MIQLVIMVYLLEKLNDQLFPNGLKSTSSALLINKKITIQYVIMSI